MRAIPMNVSGTSGAKGAASQVPVADAAQVFVLKKAINLQAANTATLLNALPQPKAPLVMSGSVGHTINTSA
jgi:Putative motility protein